MACWLYFWFFRHFSGRVVGSISVVILAACIAALLADLGAVAILASVAVVGSLTYLFIQVCSEFKLLKLELCRREIMS